MTLADTGPLVALIDAGEPDHARCRDAIAGLSAPLLTTWPVLTEAMHLLGDAAGWRGQRALWDLLGHDVLSLADLGDAERRRARALMEKYADVPMDLADATLVAVAESRGVRRILTLDRDFGVYRLHGRHAFEVVPA